MAARGSLLLALALAPRAAALAPPTWWAAPMVSAWFSPDNNWPALLPLLDAHSGTLTSLMTYCGLEVSDAGGVAGGVSALCAESLFPALAARGVRAEIILNAGNCSIAAYRALFASADAPAELVALALAANASGINFDLEPQADNCRGAPTGTAADGRAYAAFLARVRAAFAPRGLRVTVDVAGWSPVLADFSGLAAVTDRILDMSTYNGDDAAQWAAAYAPLAAARPAAARGLGLGAWGVTPVAWWCTEAAARVKVARARADGVPELALFRIVVGDPKEVWPLPFWWEAVANWTAARSDDAQPPCSLNGALVDGACACYGPWRGADCGELAVGAAPRASGYGIEPRLRSAWGGNVIADVGATGATTFHLFVAEMSLNCTLAAWGRNSFVTHATAASPEGPFVKTGAPAVNVWSHNPQVVRLPDGTYAIFHIGSGSNTPPTNCAGAPRVDGAAGANVHTSSSLDGPWTPVSGTPACNNPAPLVHANGTLFLVCDSSVLWSAPALSGPWAVAAAAPYRNRSTAPAGAYEDAFLWIDPRGNWHALFHVWTEAIEATCANATVSAHAFSADGLEWFFSPQQPYNTTVLLDDGTSFITPTRERPKLFFGADGEPTHLFNGAVRDIESCAPHWCSHCKMVSNWTVNLVVPLLAAPAPSAAAAPAPLRAGDAAALQRAVAAAVAARAPSYTVPPGVYDFSALPAGAPVTLDIAGATDFALVSGGDVEFVFPPLGGLRVTSSEHVAVEGPFVIDASPVFTTQGVISGGRLGGKWFNFTLTLEPGYAIDVARFVGARALFFNATTRLTLPNQVEVVSSALALRPLGGAVWAVAVSIHGNPTLRVPDGALCALTPVYGGPALLVANSSRFALRDVTSFGASGFTVLEAGGAGGHVYTRLRVVGRAGRLMASAADVLHSTAVAAGPTLEDSELSFAGDDLFAVHCELGILWRRVNDTAFYLIDTGGGEEGLALARPNEELYFYGFTADMPRVGAAALGAAGLERVTNATLIAEAQGAAAYIRDVLKVTMRPFSVTLFLATLAPPGVTLGDYAALVELPSRCGAGALVRNSSLHDTAGGMRLKGSRVDVRDTTLARAYGMRMLPELFWTQSVSSNITLANNTLIDCGCTPLAPHAIEYRDDIVGLTLINNTVIPVQCT